MKKVVFIIFTILSLLCYALASILLYTHFTEESPGMIMIYLIPALMGGLLFGMFSFLLKLMQKMELSSFLLGVHKLNLASMVAGVIALIYAFMN